MGSTPIGHPKMKIYFVRHGESEQNKLEEERGVEHWQGSRGGLTAQGKIQAAKAAAELKKKAIDLVISSPYDRAQETAEIISDIVQKPLETNTLFIERKNPTEIWDRFEDEPGVKEVVLQIQKNFHNNDWHHSDEENASDMKNRAQKALDYITSLPYSNIVVVSHGTFLKTVFSLILPKEYTQWNNFDALLNFPIDNGQIIECAYANKKWNFNGGKLPEKILSS